MRPDLWFPRLAILLICSMAAGTGHTETTKAKGTFRPDGPPPRQPIRIDAGTGCVVDIERTYIVEGTLSGSFDIDFRILVLGPCGSPPGTFAEEWIAHGVFNGSVNGDSASANFTYTATVELGGEVDGEIIFGQGLSGRLRVHGRFSDGQLVYDGTFLPNNLEQR
jgi:hypothetical protein